MLAIAPMTEDEKKFPHRSSPVRTNTGNLFTFCGHSTVKTTVKTPIMSSGLSQCPQKAEE